MPVTKNPLLADVLKNGGKELSVSVVLRDLSSERIPEASIGGLIGVMEANAAASVSFENQYKNDLKISSETHTGLFCNRMEAGASLNAAYTSSSAGAVTVEAEEAGADAGGFVGHMEADARLEVSGVSVNQVKSVSGNAGGLVGSSSDGSLSVKTDASAFSFADRLMLQAGTAKAAGGLIGAWTVTKAGTTEYDLSRYQLHTIVISGGQRAGGLFGILDNQNSTGKAVIAISGGAASAVTAEIEAAVTDFGGLIGAYQSAGMENMLAVKGGSPDLFPVVSSGGEHITGAYGGVIGQVSGSSYVEIEAISAVTAGMNSSSTACFGGLVGRMKDGLLNMGSVKLLTVADNDLAADNVEGRGGLVGHLEKGVLRLHGTTDLSGQKLTAAYNHTGQIVGNNGNGLVYAVGDGNRLSAGEEGWSLIRYSGTDRSGSDIGNWGAVVRFGEKLSEGKTGALSFDEEKHCVSVQNGTGADISDTDGFAAYALAFDLSAAYQGTGSSAALTFQNPVNPADKQKVTLSGDVNLTGTGIIGIGKDSTEKGVTLLPFQGSLDGRGHTVTLDIGAVYGSGMTKQENAAGQLYPKRSDQRDAHYSLALIPFAGDVAVSKVTINGNVSCRIPKTVNQEEGDIRYPAFAAGAVGLVNRKASFTGVTVNAGITVTEEEGAKKLFVWQGGFLGRCEGSTLDFTDCTWGSTSGLIDSRDTDSHRMGGLAAEVMGGCAVTVADSVLSGSLTTGSSRNALVGGLIAVCRGEDQNGVSNKTTLSVTGLQVKGEAIRAKQATVSGGGLLGYQWKNTDVVFQTGKTGGVMISGSSLEAGKATFGGLVYQAAGYWNAAAKDSIVFIKNGNPKNQFAGASEKAKPSGLLVGTGLVYRTQNGAEQAEMALYLEMGTWGTASDAAYRIEKDAVELKDLEYFDELIGITKEDDAGSSNAVVSLAVRDNRQNAVCIDQNGTTTYTGQLETNYKNGRTRYYYNLDSYRNNSALTLKRVASPEDLVLWSVAQYAAENIRGCFRRDDDKDVIITGKLDLTGYSYYPVTPLGAVNLGDGVTETELIFDYEGMNRTELSNKQLSDQEHQHTLMQHGLLYDTTHNVAVKKTSFSGTVGKEQDAAGENRFQSGALIFGSAAGNPTGDSVEISLKDVTLSGIRVTDVRKAADTYAPLLINRMTQAVKLTVDTLSTGEGYTTGDGTGRTTVYAATSLIGQVGTPVSTKLMLSFSNIALDGRLAADAENATSVWNNGTVSVEYHTTHTIFTKATLLDSFQYSSEGSGTYHFNSTDPLVTYGVELTNTGTVGRNPDRQYQYYDQDIYITDERNQTANEAYVKNRYQDSRFIRYVYLQQNVSDSRYELDINQKTTGLLKGCGTYGDPYIIEDAYQLSSLAAYISKPESVEFQAVFNSDVLESQTQTAEGYHTQGGAAERDLTYTWNKSSWIPDGQEEAASIDPDKAASYLLNAYYKIDRDLTISAGSFSGLGTLTRPFSGVIVGASQDITVSLTEENENKDSFGGLIAYSRGSVVKDLVVDYSRAVIVMQADTLPGITKNPFFGGVVGYCMGGDTIIDHVSVNYAKTSVSFNGTYWQQIAAGGYVGLAGGATHVTKESDYEKTGGGVVFRNMENTENTFAEACPEAAAENITVTRSDAEKVNKPNEGLSAAGTYYFYRNPYVGRVLDGYACAENCAVNNTDKNYTIPTLHAGTEELKVSEANGKLNVTVSSAQGLWLLSAIVNSGAGAMDASGSYTDTDRGVVDAYQYGKPRSASYEGIGTAAGAEAAARLSDEAYWGGAAGTAGTDEAKKRVSYLVKTYTEGTAAARLAGKSSQADTNIPVVLTFDADCIDMGSYGNGFRGIGASYGQNKDVWVKDCRIFGVYRRSLLAAGVHGGGSSGTVLKLNMNQNDYSEEHKNGSWRNQGAGLFVDFQFTDGCEVKNLQIAGMVSLRLFQFDAVKKSNGLTYVEEVPDHATGVGGFAVRTANSAGSLTFSDFHLSDLKLYGGMMTGGAIGYTDGFNSGQVKQVSNITFTDWSIKDVDLWKNVWNNGSSGGLVGWNNCYGRLTIRKGRIETLAVSTIAYSRKVAAAGGLIGVCDYGNVSISQVTGTGVTVTGENLRDLGGLVAGGRQEGSLSITDCVMESMEVKSTGTKNSESIGGVVGYHKKELTLDRVTVTGDSFISGEQYAGGFVGCSANKVTIQNCTADRVNINGSWNWAGGYIGVLLNTKAVVKNCVERNAHILGPHYAGGLAGALFGDNAAIHITDMEFSDVMVVNRNDNGSGLLVGNANTNSKATKFAIKGYNILAKNCRSGCNKTVTVNQMSADTKLEQYSKTGLWVGDGKENLTGTGMIRLVAVSAEGEIFPQTDIGKRNDSASVVYADAGAENAYQPTASSASPWLDVNPKSDIPFADGTVLTGNAAGSGTAYALLNELTSDVPSSDYYWNLEDQKKTYSEFLNEAGDAYLTTYRREEGTSSAVDETVDFPVLVVNNTGDVDTRIWNYIAAMTNVKGGNTAKAQTADIRAATYQWDSSVKKFARLASASLSVSNRKISIVPNAYDNQNSQFTLLDVTYDDPTGGGRVFHLYVPVLVKKVLYISFDAKFLAGTNYCAADYPAKETEGHYATAGFDEPLTAYIEYSYEKETDWQSMLDNGENLLWYYDKILDLAAGSTAVAGKPLLPAGTQLTLVDRQTKKYYTCTMGESEDIHHFDLARMTEADGKIFQPVYICDLLGLTAVTVTQEMEGVPYYVKVTEPGTATVRIGTAYYRKAGDADAGKEKYRITVDPASGEKAKTEGYYLTVQVPETSEVEVVNNRLNYAAFSRKEGTLPASITSKTSASGSGYVVYNGVEQTFTVSTSRIHNGTAMGDTVMENGDSIRIRLQSRLKLTEAGKGRFAKLGPNEFYHQFDISLKEYLQNKAPEYDVIGTELVAYQYSVSGNGLEDSKTGAIQDAAGLETMTLQNGGRELKLALEKAENEETAVTITAEITLTYAGADYFPVRNMADSNDDSGVSVTAVSRIANTKNQLSITENKKSVEDGNRYHITNPSKAGLIYSAVDGSGAGDTTKQLGINPLDSANNRSDLLYTRADYDYSGVDSAVLEQAKRIRYKLELFRKNDAGAYDEAAPLPIGEYLLDTVKDGTAPVSSGQTAYQWEEPFEQSDVKHQLARFQYMPLTGESFEAKDYTYGNYRVRLTVVLLQADGTELDGTKASDYIVYTNARLYPEILPTLPGTADGNGQ